MAVPRGPRPHLESVEDFKPTQVELAYGRIWAGIVRGRIPAGSRLVEARVAEELAMSRTPVREAIRRLEAEGLVVAEPNKGAVVRSLTVDDVADLYDLRARLEAYAARLSAERADVEDVRAIVAGAEAFRDTVGATGRTPRPRPEVDALFATNAAFHTRVVETSRHARLQQMLARAADRPLIHRALDAAGLDHLQRSATFHELIAEAIAAGDGERAERLMAEHIVMARDACVAIVAADTEAESAG